MRTIINQDEKLIKKKCSSLKQILEAYKPIREVIRELAKILKEAKE